jgi:DNA-binding HxlR family transcriptional regulator
MSSERTYGEGCAAAHALDLVGERWALLVVRELLLGPKRFTDLRTGITHASPNVLAQRLRELERSGVVRRRPLAPPAASRIYELTEWGRQLEPVIVALGRFGARSPSLPIQLGMSVDSQMLALKTVFDPAAAGALSATYELRLGDHRFSLRIHAGQIEVERGIATAPDAVIETDPPTLAALVWEGLPLDEALRDGHVRIQGDKRAVRRFTRVFPMPQPAAAAAAAG